MSVAIKPNNSSKSIIKTRRFRIFAMHLRKSANTRSIHPRHNYILSDFAVLSTIRSSEFQMPQRFAHIRNGHCEYAHLSGDAKITAGDAVALHRPAAPRDEGPQGEVA